MKGNNNNSRNFFDSAGFYIIILTIINLMNFMDRGIIPGATEEFTHFIDNTINTNTPSLYIGLLQSSFIIGISLASPFFATLAHRSSPFLLVYYGMLCWTVAATISGTAFYFKSFEVLLIGRVLSGVGEAAFVCCTAPWIVLNAPPESKSSWLALFYTTTPVGTAFGYIYSSVVSNTLGCKWAFYIEAIYMLPFLAFLFYMSKRFPLLPPGVRHYPINKVQIDGEETIFKNPLINNEDNEGINTVDVNNIEATINNNDDDGGGGGDDDNNHNSHEKPPTIWEETKIVCGYSSFNYITLGYSALTGTLIGLATFGSSFFLALGYFDSEIAASSVFGIVVSLAGIVGFPIGGVLIDYISKREHVKYDGLESHEAISDTNSIFSFKNLVDLYSSSLIMAVSSLIGMVFMCIVYFIHEVAGALTIIFIGTVFLFICNSSASIGLVYSIPMKHRSFGLALNLIGMHMLGDVPSPLIAGYLKDKLAPGCVGDDDEVGTSDGCRDDAHGVRITMLIISMWLIWCGVFFGLSTLSAWKEIQKKVKGNYNDNNGGLYQSLVDEDDVVKKSTKNY